MTSGSTPPHRRVFDPILCRLVSLKPSPLSSLCSIKIHRKPLSQTQMSPHVRVFIFVLLFCFVSASSKCLHRSKAAFFPSSVLSDGSCGYDSMARRLNSGFVAAGSYELYRGGAGCGDCYQIRCKNTRLCSSNGVKVTITDMNNSNDTGFILSSRAFAAMARREMARDLKDLGSVDVEYKRIACAHQKRLIKVEESSENPNHLKIKFLGREKVIVAVDVARAGSSEWRSMNREIGDVWEAMHVPVGTLQLRVVMMGKWMWAEGEVLPAEWRVGAVYSSGVELGNPILKSCTESDTTDWK